MTARATVKVCYRCRQSKEKYNSNGYCPECDRIRHRERLAAIREQTEEYVKRHQERRAREAALEATFERVERAPDSNAGEMFLDLNNPEPVFRDLTNQMLRQQQRKFSWKVA